ncbi:MAG: aminotransferase class I/II-fold pyridoxal phosphate-dependent enzyme [Gemmatimonadota bacterium]|jgi:methionine-gamma-lyase
MDDVRRAGPHTRIIHGGQQADPETGAVSTPIYQSSTFAFTDADQGADRFSGAPGWKYTRLGNPTVAALERNVALLEHGCGALGAATGMAAINSVYLTFLGQGAHAVVTDCVYGPTRTILETEYTRFGVEATFVDSSHPDNVARALRPNTKLVYIESPANPTLRLTDIARCADIAHRAGAILVVDNTFASPYLQNPLQLGADVVVHSMTKFINGHTDVVAGIIVARKEEVLERIRAVHVNLGGTMDPHQAWLVLRGIKTLGLRMERAQANARALAYYLQRHAAVKWVNYPGLVDHPQHDLMKQQMRGPGALVCFGVRGGLEAGRRFINGVELATLAVSLGGIETLIEHPASMTHAGVSPDERSKAGITDDLVRIAVGCEDYDDLERDLEQAFEKAMAEEATGV